MKLIYTCIAILVFVNTYSQVGIGTVTPQSDLHISNTGADDGSIQIDGAIRLGGNDTTQGSKGLQGQFLISNGPTGVSEWVTVGDIGGYISDCAVPNATASITFSLPDGSNRTAVNVTSAQIGTALNSLPKGGLIILRTNTANTYNSATTYITVELPIAASFINKPFAIAFDGPVGTNNSIDNNKNFQILVIATEANSILYEFDSGSVIPKVFLRKFDVDNIYEISELNNDTGATREILLYNSGTIKALNTKTWAFLTRDCYVQNPNH